jgi:hypothetical protein
VAQQPVITQQLAKYNKVQQSGWWWYTTSYVPKLTDMTVLYDYEYSDVHMQNPLILINVRQHL